MTSLLFLFNLGPTFSSKNQALKVPGFRPMGFRLGWSSGTNGLAVPCD